MKQFIFYLLFIFAGFSLCMMSCGSDDPAIPGEEEEEPPVETKLDIDTLSPATPMRHVGGLHTEEDFARIRTKLTMQEEPWVAGWQKLAESSFSQSHYLGQPQTRISRGVAGDENYVYAMKDAAAAYQLALRWKISGDEDYAKAAIGVLNGWAAKCTEVVGNTNVALAAGIYGYEFAVAGELMRDYEGWNAGDFRKYQQWMLDKFYTINLEFLEGHFGTVHSHYWANWDLCNLASALAIGILCDKRSIYNHAVNYLQNGYGNGNLNKAVNHVHKVGEEELGQLQESGRDQGHSTMCIALMGVICQLTWNQGDDFYGYKDNLFLKACEYTSKYNTAMLEVPFEPYTRAYQGPWGIEYETHTVVSYASRGIQRPSWTAPYYHYTKIKNVSASKTKYTLMGVNATSPGGGGDGNTSGAYDQLGFGTLMYTR